ncbi:MAG: sigma-54-dependent Fis family transcriptional regulator [Acidobacteria bacterium]|uniref:Sigma-54-dependent Fis family transcriptional regulator n=1 Tax=Candidatus Sulfomarinibacter kjeldsenii TaxID=2885994 RepID=A0A8J6YAY6_9BACT|nr:sigma-54-dependent Fis family transcriptional regulator [Candidatus Sulfomarinibacter kjeldsenii]
MLIADDQGDVLESLRLLLKPEGYAVETAHSPDEAAAAVAVREFDAALVDLNYSREATSGAEGLELLEKLQGVDSTLPVVVMTAWGSVEIAVQAIRLGARDFIEKPWDNDRLLTILRNQVDLCRALRRGRRLEAENTALLAAEAPVLIATAPSMEPVLELISRVGPSDANILITGEHGSGKEVVARRLHAVSARGDRPLVTVNVGGLPDGVFASEFFGHVKGAFTDAKGDRVGRFEMADGGTLFLDEIANLPFDQQAKLLRTLETGELERVGSSKTSTVDARILSATNADLKLDVAEGRFREDLLFRLNTVEIRLPPLRDRPEDIPLLANHFLGRFAQKYRQSEMTFDGAATTTLLRHPWPGNVRELAHVVERAVLMAGDDVIKADHLGLAGGAATATVALDEMSLDDLEKVFIEKAMRRYDGNVSHAAEALGLSRSALYRRLEKHGL